MTVHNQIDTDQVRGFTEILRAHPDAGALTIRTRHRWTGGYTLALIDGSLEVAGQVIPRSPDVTADRPEVFGGTDTAPAPGELLLSALAACVGGQFAELAALQDIDLADVEITCEARGDVRGALDMDDVRPGLQQIDIRLSGEGADSDTMTELLASAVRTSPIADSLAGTVTLSAESG